MIDASGLGIVTFNLAATIIAVTCLFYTLLMGRFRRLKNKLFISFIIIVIVDSLTVIAGQFLPVSGLAYGSKLILFNVLQFIYFLTHFAIAPFFALYIILVCNVSYRFSKKVRFNLVLPFYFLELLILTNPLTHLVYSYDANLTYHRGPGVYVAYLEAAFYLLFAIVALFMYWSSLTVLKKVALIYFFVIIISGTLIQMFFIDIKVELMCEAIGLIGIMIVIENDDDRLDMPTKAYNRNAFTQDVTGYYRYKRNFFTICIRIINADVYRKITGYETYENILAQVVSFITSLSNSFDVYRASHDCLLVVCPDIKKEAADSAAYRIFERLCREWIVGDNKVVMKSHVLMASCPDQFVSLDHLYFLTDSSIEGESVDVLSGSDLDFILRRADVESAVKRGKTGINFNVCFEPIYTMEDLAICGASAILTFSDDELGNIAPSEFMPVAEQTGLIEELGWYTIDQAFYFLGGGIAEEMGLEFIEISVSAVQLIKSDFVGHVRELMKKYGVRPNQIVFDISETSVSTEQDVLGVMMSQLSGDGIRFYMGEYGTGFFNMRSVSSMVFEGVIMDASMIGEADAMSQRRIILENRLKMMNQMGKKIVIDKVDSQELFDSISPVKADYLKGAFFSEAVSRNEFIAILRATEMARMEERRAKAANDAKTNFLANMSHEIRTPINAVLGMNEVILRECKDEKILEYAQNIEGAGRTLLSLINDILDFSKIEAGSMEISEVDYDFSSVLNDIYNMIRIKADQKALELIFDIDETLPDSMHGDEMRLRQIIVNILNNAIKYTTDGTVTLKVSGIRDFDDRITLKIDVSDTGMGIRDEDKVHLFEKFKRLDIDKNKTVEGSGLGLAITSSLLDLMGGSITVDSEYGKGSTFTMLLPQGIVSDSPIGDFKSRIASSSKAHKKYREKLTAPDALILVVDDTPMNHVVIRELLKPTLVRVESARSGLECLQKQHEKPYDLIFLDYRMPGMDGIETLKEMNKDTDSPNRHTPVVVLTANAISGARENFIREGFDDYLSKPVESSKLEETLIKYLPKEKINLTSDEETHSDTGVEADTGERPGWLDSMDMIDADEGLRNCGSIDSYVSILKVFYESCDMNENNIVTAFEDENWKDYTSFVHSLKSTSRTIGAKELSKLAERLERAGNENDIETIKNRQTELMNLYSIVRYSLSEVPVIREEEEKADSDGSDAEKEKNDITSAQLKDAYQSIIEVSRTLDYDTLSFILDSLKTYRLPEVHERNIRKITNLSYKLSWEEIINVANDGLNMV
ncbi:MAG: EAL domain-containing protein [Butyrivibrio sp.]|nr:EAL domain-containing protein [Butyrivibrio sp.]